MIASASNIKLQSMQRCRSAELFLPSIITRFASVRSSTRKKVTNFLNNDMKNLLFSEESLADYNQNHPKSKERYVQEVIIMSINILFIDISYVNIFIIK